jgi:hypothetical protein
LTDQACDDIGRAASGKADDHAHGPSWIGLRLCHARGGWERGSARGQMQEFAAGKFHGTLLFSRHVSAEYRATRSLSPALL